MHSMSSMSDMPDMPDMGHDDMCDMSMVLNGGYKNLCILTSKWRITSKFQMVLSMLAIILITMGYEVFKRWTSTFEARYKAMEANGTCTPKELKSFKFKDSIIYGVTVLYSFTIMLLFMTFNVWVMAAVTVGAILGHFFFADGQQARETLACH